MRNKSCNMYLYVQFCRPLSAEVLKCLCLEGMVKNSNYIFPPFNVSLRNIP